MPTVTVTAPAKINLSLDVIGRRDDGYHLLTTIMQSIDLADLVTVRVNEGGSAIRLTCGQSGIPTDSRNTAWRAASLFLAAADLRTGIAIEIEKKIPAAAGLAGGSADAAAVLLALDHFFPNRLIRADLFALAAKIGADVPFCLKGGTALCEGIGDKMTELQPFAGVPVLLCKPDFSLSTPWVFSRLNLAGLGRRPNHQRVLTALRGHDLGGLAANTANVLESVALTAHPVLQVLKNQLLAAGAVLALMSGSGPTVYGLFNTQAECDAACASLAARIRSPILMTASLTVGSGPQILR